MRPARDGRIGTSRCATSGICCCTARTLAEELRPTSFEPRSRKVEPMTRAWMRSWTLGALLLAQPLAAQAECSSRVISGSVLTHDGSSLEHLVVGARGTACATSVDSLGSYALHAPADSLLVYTAYIGYPGRWAIVPAGSGDLELNFSLPELAERSRDWSGMERRPAASEPESGVAGCYWVGAEGAWPRILRLEQDGSVPMLEDFIAPGYSPPPGDPDGWWAETTHPTGILVSLGRDYTRIPVAALSLTPPVDWSVIPAIMYDYGEADVRSIVDSFVTRIDCPPGPGSP